MAKRKYIKMELTQVEFEPGSTLLVGSKTSKSIKVNEVEVEDFKQGFGTDSSNDFQVIDFD